MRTENECDCACHRNPAVMHIIACCEPDWGEIERRLADELEAKLKKARPKEKK